MWENEQEVCSNSIRISAIVFCYDFQRASPTDKNARRNPFPSSRWMLLYPCHVGIDSESISFWKTSSFRCVGVFKIAFISHSFRRSPFFCFISYENKHCFVQWERKHVLSHAWQLSRHDNFCAWQEGERKCGVSAKGVFAYLEAANNPAADFLIREIVRFSLCSICFVT